MIKRLNEVPWNEREFLEATGLSVEAFEQFVSLEKAKIGLIRATYRSVENDLGNSVVEFVMEMADGKTHCRRSSWARARSRKPRACGSPICKSNRA